MIPRTEKNMQVTPDTLEQRETKPRKEKDARDEIKARIAAARTRTVPDDVHCRDCFLRGREAALLAIEDEA